MKVDLVDGKTGKPSGTIEAARNVTGSVELKLRKQGIGGVTVTLPPTLARRIGEALLEAAGPAKPTLTLVKAGDPA